MNAPQSVDETAFAMLGMPPGLREALFRHAFEQAMAKHPEVTEVPLPVVLFVSAVMERVAELEQLPMGRA